MPSLLQYFIFTLVGNKTKLTTLGHALSRQLDHCYCSIDVWFRCFSISYFWLPMLLIFLSRVDHNVCILDGLGTFHGIGIISMTTANINSETSSIAGSQLAIPTLTCNKQSIVIRNRRVSLARYLVLEHYPLSSAIFQPWLHLQQPYVLPLDTNLDLLWHSGWIFITDSSLRST
jgi:hypothetical protein